MSRYEKTSVGRKNLKGSNVIVSKYDTTIYEKIPLDDNDIFIITQQGDRLDSLAFQFYEDPDLWWYIAQANHINTMNVEAGTSLRIPSSTSFTDTQ